MAITPCIDVFSIAELSDPILAHLDCKQLFVTQLVCRTFQHAILNSPMLARKMFLKPRLASEKLCVYLDDAAVERCRHKNKWVTHECELADEQTLRVSAALNPLITLEACRTWGRWHLCPDGRKIPFFGRAGRVYENIVPLRTRDLLYPRSWHGTLLSQPPCKRAEFRLYGRLDRTNSRSTVVIVENEDGITFGQLIDAALQKQYRTLFDVKPDLDVGETFSLIFSYSGQSHGNLDGSSPVHLTRMREHVEALEKNDGEELRVWEKFAVMARD